MSTTLACIGLHVDGLDELNGYLEQMPTDLAGRADGVESVRFADASGARVVVARDAEGDTVDLVPSYDGEPGVRLGALAPFGPVVRADVLGDDQEIVTRIAFDLEQRRHLSRPMPGPLRACVIALGLDMTVYADTAAFRASDPSVTADETLTSYGLLNGEDAAEPTAFLAGSVLGAETHTHDVTGQVFHVARVRTLGVEVTVCLPGSDHPTAPATGSVVAGSCYLVVDVPTLWVVEPPRRGRRRRR